MISVAEAKAIIAKNITALQPQQIPLDEAANHTLAQNVFATVSIPAFAQSTMDGYAIRFADKKTALNIVGEMAAGGANNFVLNEGEAVRIFTGALLPDGADTVVMQEKVLVQNEKIVIVDEALKMGGNVRSVGAEAMAGSLAMEKGNPLWPAAIGFLAGIGVTHVLVYPMPSVTIIVTGNELQTPGNVLSAGQVYESNSFSLRAALQQAGIKKIDIVKAEDDLQVLKNSLTVALNKSDVVLLTGGVSVGAYDFVVEAATLCGVQQCFHKVKQRPGKPLYFGMKNTKPVFGLPGNPSSVLTCFYYYVLPALQQLACKQNSIKKLTARLTNDVTKTNGLTHFLKGHYENGTAAPLNAQESFRLSSFAQANCLIALEENKTEYTNGEIVEVYLLPGIN